MTSAGWWTPHTGEGRFHDSGSGQGHQSNGLTPKSGTWLQTAERGEITDDAILRRIDTQLGQVRSRDRVRDNAEVFTHSREISAMLDQVQDAFTALDVKFLEPACGSGNFLVAILQRKLALIDKRDCGSQGHYEHQLLRATASVYGIDIFPGNIAEARGRMAHALLEHYQPEPDSIRPTEGFLHAAAAMLGCNIIAADTLNEASNIELCDWQPRPDECFVRVWSNALIPEDSRDLFWSERIQDSAPVHYSALVADPQSVQAHEQKAAL